MKNYFCFLSIALVYILSSNVHLAIGDTTGKNSSDNSNHFDIVIIGGTPAGIAAGIAAGKSGKKVIIIEQSPVLGGVLSSGVIRLDDYYVASNSGIIESFRQRVRTYHRTQLANDPLVKAHLDLPPNRPWNLAEGRAWEPHTASRIFADMIAEWPSITTRFNEVAVDVHMGGNRVKGVVTRHRDNQGNLGATYLYSGKIIIDATYEADLASFANIPFRIGREARSNEEPHAGRIYTNFFRSVPGRLKATILPNSSGEADDRSQAFTYRLTGKDYGRADHPFRLKEPPQDYDPSKYRWNRHSQPIIPNRKFDLLGISWGGDLTGYGTRWVLSNWEERNEIEKIFRNYDLGWLYYIQTEGGSPHIGLPDDEFLDNNHLPYRLYVRQGRRIEGHYTLTESDIHKDLRGNGLRGPLNPDSVAIGVYAIDAHNVTGPTQRNEPPHGEGAAEGTLHLFDVTGPYQIPYGVMVPKQHEGILFPVGISSTHVAMCTVRMEPVWSALGQAAGTAAALALDHALPLKDVPIELIQKELVQQGCALYFYTDLPGSSDAFEAVQMLSLLGAMDDHDVDRFQRDQPATSLTHHNIEAYRFRPNDPVTLGEFARMVVKGLQVPLSITASHFNDVRRGHRAFKYVETLYDYSSQSLEPFFDYEQVKITTESGQSQQILAHPDWAINREKAVTIISGLMKEQLPPPVNPDTLLTRSEAAKLIYHYATNR
ncbi:FAD-dependent oxidoreductase [bacterium]|nr:FAD-dependent oxidoreductase [bacterium]